MDSGLGHFNEIDSDLGERLDALNDVLDGKDQIPVFQVGETLNVKGGTYEVDKIQKHRLVLKPVGRSTKHLHGEE